LEILLKIILFTEFLLRIEIGLVIVKNVICGNILRDSSSLVCAGITITHAETKFFLIAFVIWGS
jgi:hypothetical protein